MVGGTLWNVTVDLPDGEYTYKFRNGYETVWADGAAPFEANETGGELATGGCAVGNFSDRHVVVPPLYGDGTYGPFCWGTCFACSSPSHPVFPPPPPAVAAPGWFPTTNVTALPTCDSTCAEVNLICTSIAQAAHSDEVDECDEMEALIEKCCRKPAGTCNPTQNYPHFNTAIDDNYHTDVPFNSWTTLDASGTFDDSSIPERYNCSILPSSAADILNAQKRTLCYCHLQTEYVNYHCLSSAGPSIITSSGVFYSDSPKWRSGSGFPQSYFTHPTDGGTGIFDINLDMLSTGGSVSCARFTGTYVHAAPGSTYAASWTAGNWANIDGCEVSLFHISDDYPNGRLIQTSIVNHAGQPNVSTASFDHDIPAGVRALRFQISPRASEDSDWCQLVKPCLHSCLSSGDHTFSYTGSSQFYNTGGATSFNVSLWGAGGGRGAHGQSYQQGGAGGYTSAIVYVPEGTTTLEVIVGGAGARGVFGVDTPIAFGGGGIGAAEGSPSNLHGGGGGGGRSAIIFAGNDLITAGGGGGGGYCTSGRCGINDVSGGFGGGLVGGDGGDGGGYGSGIAGLGGRTTLSAGPTEGWPGLYDDSLCRDTCEYPADNLCDDGGWGSEFGVCIHGTDCTDCGPRAQPAALSVNAGGRGGQGSKRIGDNGTQFTGGNANVAGEGCAGWCSMGIEAGELWMGSDYRYCCSSSCGTCAGPGCDSRPGGSAACCGGEIRSSGVYCADVSSTVCIIPPSPPPPCSGYAAAGGGGGYYGGGAGGATIEYHGAGGGGSGYAAPGSTQVDMRNGTNLPEGPGIYPSAGTEESNGLVIIRRHIAPPPPPPRPPVNPPPPRAPWHVECREGVTLDEGIQLHRWTRCGFTRLVRININGKHACGVRGDEAIAQLLTFCDEMCRTPYPPIARKTLNYRAMGMLAHRTSHRQQAHHLWRQSVPLFHRATPRSCTFDFDRVLLRAADVWQA